MVDEKHFDWARYNHLKLYPQCIIETYTKQKMIKGRKKKVIIPLVEIMVEINGSCKRVAELPHLHHILGDDWKFKQDDKVYEVIAKLYEFYYNRAHESNQPGN